MLMGYKSFLMDIGTYGNTLGYNYNWYSGLATDNTCFKNVWELLHDFNVGATFGEEFQLHPIQEGDQSLMELFSRHYSSSYLASLNVFRQHKKIIHISCIVLYNGRTINTDCFSMTHSHSDRHKFPLQYPTCSDHSLWKVASKTISSPFYTFPMQLGNYMEIPHKSVQWLTCSMRKMLHKTIKADDYVVYIRRPGQTSRSGKK
jgi:hypothetical protein